MNNPNQLTNKILREVKIEALDLFDKNIVNKGFFGSPWQDAKMNNHRGSLMQRTGKLRRSIRGDIKGTELIISSDMPYAEIQNDGGTITVTPKMKRFFWAKYYEIVGGDKSSLKTRKRAKISPQRLRKAEPYKAMALMKVGSKITIPQRQFVGDHPKLQESIETIIQLSVEDFLRQTFKDRLV